MQKRSVKTRAKLAATVFALGSLLQFGGCNLGTITTTQTLDGQDAIIQIIRGAILTPIDAWITNAVERAFDNDDD